MDLAATQIYEDEDFPLTQKISHAPEEEELVQIGRLNINSIDYQIKKGTTKIGRLSSCDIVINDVTVSKIHAEIEASGGQGSTWICDLNSSNKTKLNNLTLRPNRSYELKDGSIIDFGRVIATYRAYCPADDTVIPETPAPPRQRAADTIIPNTPDLSLNNLSGMDDDGSVILGTQRDDENKVFRRPLVPQQRQSTSIGKKNTSQTSSVSGSDDSQITTVLHTSNIDISDNREGNLFDMETQKLEEERKTTSSNSIHDIETQRFPMSEHLVDTNAKANKQVSPIRLNNQDKRVCSSATNIHDMETQNYVVDINEAETQKSGTDIRNVTTEGILTTDIHDVETQNHIDGTDQNDSNTQKSDIDENVNREKSLGQVECNIHDLETQKFSNKYIAQDIFDFETQFDGVKNTIRNISNVETQLGLDGITRTTRDISDVESQLETDNIVNINNDQIVLNKDKDDMVNITKNGTNYEKAGESPKSRSASPGSLNLSSPGVDEDECPSSPLNHSDHLLETTDLLEYFSENIDKQEEIRASNASTPKPRTKTSSDRDNNTEKISNVSDNGEENDEDNIFDAPTQRVSCSFENVSSDNSKTDDEDAFVMCRIMKRKRRKPQLKQIGDDSKTDDDSETDAEEYLEELAKKQRESLVTSSKSCENVSNKNDPGTSVESEDMFDVPTQQLNNLAAKDTLNQLSKINETAIVDDIASTQIINVGTACDENNRVNASSIGINDMATQLILPRIASPKTTISSKDSLSKNNQNDVDDMAHTQIIDTNVDLSKSIDCPTPDNLDHEDIDYEMAPTQVIGEVEDEENRNFDRKKSDGPQENLNDTLEQKLNEMFDNVNNDSIQEPPQISTQYLEDILECDNDLSANKSIVADGDTDNVPQEQSGKETQDRDQSSPDLLGAATDNVNNVEIDSQDSDVYFSTITTRRKRNILRNTQELVVSVVDIRHSQDINFSLVSKDNNQKAKDNNIITKSNKKGTKVPKSKNKPDVITDTLNDDNVNKTISNESNERSSKMTRRNNRTESGTNRQAERSSVEVDDAEENLTSDSNCAPCPSGNGQRAQTLDTLYESDDDILTRLPAVRISGTLSNPASPSVSLTSTVRSPRFMRGAARNRGKKVVPLKDKSAREQDVEDSEKDKNLNRMDDKPLILPLGDHSLGLGLDTLKTAEVSDIDTSEDSDYETNYKRFKQIAARMLNNELNYLKRQSKGNVKKKKIKIAMSDEEKNARSSPDLSKSLKQNTNVRSKSPLRTSSRTTRHSSRQNNEGSAQKEARTEDVTDRSTKAETMFTIASSVNRKRSLSIEEDVEQINSRKRKAARVIEERPILTRSRRAMAKTATDRQSPNILEYFVKTTSRENSPVIENTVSSQGNKTEPRIALEKIRKTSSNPETGDVDSERSIVRRTRRKINNNQSATRINDTDDINENSDKNKQTQTKEETMTSQVQEKVLKILLSPIKSPIRSPVRAESQEVEMIMARDPSNVQDDNLSIREKSNVKIFQRESRTRGRKRANADTETNPAFIESSESSDIGDSDNTQPGNPASRVTRRRPAKSSVYSLPEAQFAAKKETFKKPTRMKQNSTRSILDASMKNLTGGESQDNTESDVSSSSKVSSSKTARMKKKGKIVNQNTRRTINDNASPNANVEIMSTPSTPSRTRRSMSVLSNSTPPAAKHKVLFTGITEDYSKTVKTLGGSKVEDPAKCTVLVTDKVRRTYKFLCALAQGVPIVAIDWLKDSESATRFLDWQGYMLKDPVAEAKFGFRLRKSLDKAKEKKLLNGYTIVLTPSVAPPPIEELKDMVTSCGGKVLLRPPAKWPERAIIVSREEDLPNARKFLAKAPRTVTVQSTEFILTGILRQETDFDKYKLI